MVKQKGGTPTKLFKKLAIALTVITTAFVLGTTALAGLYDQGSGGSFISAKYGSYAYGWRNGTDLLWQVEVYVAKTDDGIIDKTKPSITDNFIDDNIAYVGTLLYTDGISGNIIMQSQSYASERNNGVNVAPVFYELSPYQKISYYNMPLSTGYYNKNAPFLNESRELFTYSYLNWNGTYSERTMYVLRNEPRGLPTSISGSYNYANTKLIIESEEFLSGIVEDLKTTIGTDPLNILLSSLLQDTDTWRKTDEYAQSLIKSGFTKEDAQNKALARLYPDSPDPLVQWAVVATPLAVNTANCGYDIGFWITRDRTPETGYLSLDVITTQNYGTISFAMDAYTQAWYNGLTRNMFNLEGYREYLNEKYKIPLSYLENGTGGINSGQPIQGSYTENWGLLRKEYSTNFNKLADIAYIDSTRWPDHCLGIYSPKDDWHSSASTYARYGGITIAFSKEPKDNTVPVYYYITPDPNDPTQTDPKSVPVDKPFTPNPPPGTTVKKVVIPDEPLPGSNPPQDFPPDQPAVPKNPDGTYPIEPDNLPYILVECEQTAIPVYYHVFTFTNTTGKKYTDVFDFLKDNPSIGESSKNVVETITCKETVLSLADNKTAQYKPTGDSVVAALSTSTVMNGTPWSTIITGISNGRYDPTISAYYTPERSTWSNPMKQALGKNQSVTYVGKTFTKSATRSIHVKVYTLADSEPIEGPERDTDRIKTYDVTQFIVIDDSSTPHIRITDKTNKELSAEEGSFSVPDVVMFELDCEGKSEESGAVILRRLRRERRALGLFLRYVIMNSWRKCI